jgi:hypothetical protein
MRYHDGMKKKKKRRRDNSDRDTGTYTCPTCGEEIVIPLDATQGSEQSYVEDCPVCCHPNIIHVEFDPAWETPRVWAESE